MTYALDLQNALIRNFGKSKVVFMRDWRKSYTGSWHDTNQLPVALMLHHSAAAATESTAVAAPGNQRGANNGVISFIQNHYDVPAANFTLDRDGTVYVHAAFPIWHAGLGSFSGKAPWNTLGIPKDQANRWTLGVEIISKGLKPDFTAAQKHGVAALAHACASAGHWPNTLTKRLPRHRDWTTRKVDIRDSNETVQQWITTFSHC